jgi:flagellar biosynthetic protein FliR
MEFTLTQVMSWVGAFLWTMVRTAGMVAVAPVFGARMIPVRIRVLVVLALTWIILPLVPPIPQVDPLSLGGMLVTAQQLLIGIVMGFAVQLVFAALVVGGQIIAMSMGLGFASMVDPQNGIQVPVLSQYYVMFGTLIFLAMNGHLALIELLVQSFHTLPVSAGWPEAAGLWQLVSWGRQIFAGGLHIALPTVTAIMVTHLAFGVVTRAAPQLNIFAVGFPVVMLLGFIAMWVTVPFMLPRLTELVLGSLDLVRLLIAKQAP